MTKVFTLQQPWATLLCLGAKIIETRGFDTKKRGVVLISASKNFSDENKEIASTGIFRDVLVKAGFLTIKPILPGVATEFCFDMPKGCIIGSVNIIDTAKTNELQLMADANVPLKVMGENAPKDWKHELEFGDYSKGRYGWLTANNVHFKKDHYTPFVGGVGFTKSFDGKICFVCGHTLDTMKAIGNTETWVLEHLCSACYHK